MKPPAHSLLLVDGHALLFRAFHALPPLQTKDGRPTNAIYGFITTLFKALEDIKPQYCAVAFDVGRTTFRTEVFEGYKASRAQTPDDLAAQIPYAYEIVKSLNIPIFTQEGFEADDVIGTLAKQAKEKKIPVVILTGDRDSYQLVDDTTLVYLMSRGATDVALFDADAVKESMGVRPDQITDYKALAGDSSDEIPGIEGIGPKTATIILNQVDSIAALYDRLKKGSPLNDLSERIQQKLIDGEASARQSLELATIRHDVPITLDLELCKIHDYDANHAKEVFESLEFYSLLKRLQAILPSSQGETLQKSEQTWQWEIVTERQAIERMVKELSQAAVVAIDTETDGFNGPILGISLAVNGEKGYYLPLIKEHGAMLTKQEVAEILRPLLTNWGIGKIGHNIKYDLHSLGQMNLEVTPIAFDTIIAAYILSAHLRNFDLDSLCMREFGYTKISFKDLAGRGKDATLASVEVAKVAEYAVEDVVMTYRLYEIYKARLAAVPELQKVAQEIDFPLIHVLTVMEEHGVCLDTKLLENLEKELDKEINQIRTQIESYSQEPINVNSPAQLQKLLFDDLGLAKTNMKATKTGISTAAGELEKLQGLHPVIDQILRYRELTKLQSTYITTLPKLVDKNGRLHTEFSQTTAATGRLASNNPNLQNIPIRNELGQKIRQAFVAPKGYQLLSIDYSQMELRLIAELSGDKNLIKAFKDGRDIHDEVAQRLKIDRRAAKTINFGILYGLSAFGLSQSLKIDQHTAKQYIDAYFANYPDLTRYLQETKQQVKEKGYVETLFGRRREIPEIHASNAILRAAAERMAINMPAQGSLSDIIKLAMIQIQDWLEKEFADKTERPYLTLQVHDELLLEVPDDLVKPVATKVKAIMENVCDLSVPLVADPAVGPNWGKLKDLEV